ncbi:MAG: BON domain-containing protein [Herbaspirillum sp.]
MNSVFKNLRTVFAILFFGAFLAGCNKTDTAPAMPATDTPATVPAPDTSSAAPTTTPDASSAAPSDSSSTMASDAHAAVAVVDDTVITGKIKTALLADESVKGLEIHVDTKAGDVNLSGTVENQTQIDNALRIAHGVEGVKNVNNALVIKAG